MQKYKKNYLRYFGLDPGDTILCEVCNAVAVDIHHIKYKSRGGTDDISNLIALCRPCHQKAHFTQEPYLKEEILFGIVKQREVKEFGTDPF